MSTSPAVTISRVIPNVGPLAGGTQVAVLGSHFPRSSRCLFGSEEAAITWLGESSLMCISPLGRKPGPVSLTVGVGRGDLDIDDDAGPPFFTYQDDLYKELAAVITSIVQEPGGSGPDTVDALPQPPAESVFSGTRSIRNEVASGEFSTVDVQRVIIDLIGLLHGPKGPECDAPDSDSPDSDSLNSSAESVTEKLALVSESGRTLLHLSAALGFRDLLRELIDHEVELDQCDISGRTALHYAALYGHVGCVGLLVDGGADVQIKDKRDCLAGEMLVGKGTNFLPGRPPALSRSHPDQPAWTEETFIDSDGAEAALFEDRSAFVLRKDIMSSIPSYIRRRIAHADPNAHVSGFQKLFIYLNSDGCPIHLRELIEDYFSECPPLCKHLNPATFQLFQGTSPPPAVPHTVARGQEDKFNYDLRSDKLGGFPELNYSSTPAEISQPSLLEMDHVKGQDRYKRMPSRFPASPPLPPRKDDVRQSPPSPRRTPSLKLDANTAALPPDSPSTNPGEGRKELKEFADKHKLFVEYTDSSVSAQPSVWRSLVYVDGKEMGSGIGRTKRAAKDLAAIQAVQQLRNKDFVSGIS